MGAPQVAGLSDFAPVIAIVSILIIVVLVVGVFVCIAMPILTVFGDLLAERVRQRLQRWRRP